MIRDYLCELYNILKKHKNDRRYIYYALYANNIVNDILKNKSTYANSNQYGGNDTPITMIENMGHFNDELKGLSEKIKEIDTHIHNINMTEKNKEIGKIAIELVQFLGQLKQQTKNKSIEGVQLQIVNFIQHLL